MPAIQDTVYPRLKANISKQELNDFYTPTDSEIIIADKKTQIAHTKICFLISFKTFQRLGYFVPLSKVPMYIVDHIMTSLATTIKPKELRSYDRSNTRDRHMTTIREYLNVTPYGDAARKVIRDVVSTVARTRNDRTDLINVAIEALIHERFELPAFGTISRMINHIRNEIYEAFYSEISEALGEERRQRIDNFFDEVGYISWNKIKADPGRPTLTEFKKWIAHYEWFAAQQIGTDVIETLPDAKQKHFAGEALSLDGAQMKELRREKRYTLVACALTVRATQALDDVVKLFIKRVMKIHHRGREAQSKYRQQHQPQTDDLISVLQSILTVYQQKGTLCQLMNGMAISIGANADELLKACDSYVAQTTHSYYSFLLSPYSSHRKTLFHFLDIIPLCIPRPNQRLATAITFLQAHQHNRADWLDIMARNPDGTISPLLDLSWISDTWWPLVTGQNQRHAEVQSVHHRYFEICLFSEIIWNLNSGDIYVEGSDEYADPYQKLISWEEYHEMVEEYGEQVGIPVVGSEFAAHVRKGLADQAKLTDDTFQENAKLTFEKGKIHLKRTGQRTRPPGWKAWRNRLVDQIELVNVLDVLVDVENWLDLSRYFSLISGNEARIDNAKMRYLITLFCYGCNLGPSQTARALKGLHRLQISRLDKRHITEDSLDRANDAVINAYNRFKLPRYWGKGKTASADGTKWNVYENNLLAEYHIRYGGYGGIGYYHVADSYIALFSRFIPCGVYEAIYILDGLLENQSDIQPDTLHADTHGQSEVVFGLAYLLGIQMMPRIRRWRKLKFYRPRPATRYIHIDDLFSGNINWRLISQHLPDMLRIVLSIKVGRITSSAILRRLGSYSRKNGLYRAFRELGRAMRTQFLLRYMSEEELRQVIQAATNRSEAFNNFVKWISFGGIVINKNNREAQRKIIKYNHLVANCLIFHSVVSLTQALNNSLARGAPANDELLTVLSPYLTEHINRFGNYTLNGERQSPQLGYDLPIVGEKGKDD